MRDYSFDAPAFEITKSYRDDNGVMLVEGMASTTNVDVTGERMSAEAIAKMAARLIGKPLRSEHGKGWDDKLGEIIKADIVSDNYGKPSLWIKARLYDWSTKAKDLFTLLKSGTQMGLSVAGKINPGGILRQYVEKLGKYVLTYVDIDPTEVSVTDHPANLDAFDLAVAKSLNLDETEKRLDDKDYMALFKTEDITIEKEQLLNAIEQFNKEKLEGYSDEQWATMGALLAKSLMQEQYHYDDTTMRIIKLESSNEKEVTNMNKSTLKVPKDVADFIKAFNPAENIGGEVKKVDTKEVAKEVEKAAKAEPATDTTTSTTEPKKTEKKDKGDELSTLLSSLEDTLSNMSGGEGKEGADEKTEESKPEPKKTEKAENSDDEVKASISKAIESLNAVKEAMQKTKKADQTPSSQTSDKTMAKTLEQVIEAIKEVKKSQDEMKEKLATMPNERKSIAHVVEKNLNEDKKEDLEKSRQAYTETLEKLKTDESISTTELYKYRTYGILPKSYKKS